MARSKKLVVGFKDESRLAKRVASLLKAETVFAAAGKYRAGELKLSGPVKTPATVVVAANVHEDPESLFRVLSLAHELRSAGAHRLVLLAPWIAYGRQDRATHPGEEPMGLMVGKLLSAMFDRIVTLDAHSPDFIAAFRGKLVNVLPWTELEVSGVDLVAAPDHGAMERASLAADALGVPFIVIEKERDGRRVTAKIPAGTSVKGARVLIVDDMADSGGTLKAAAQALMKAGAASVEAMVTHVFDLSSLESRLSSVVKHVRSDFNHIDCAPKTAALRLLTKSF